MSAVNLTTRDEAVQLLQGAHFEIWNAGHGLGTPEMSAAFAAVLLQPDAFIVINVGVCRV